ncbi:MFS general substrate transporter [Lentinus tigrinus ALCF2SS1-7]|uniref:MFS general substrate transporter n=1 Tax=Lentinus tigrinus ALCF2SS1-6 TaxID=1328759 RepID=A0A5C2SRZ5_9APHY|nr:MFS general substrate transporter [Lentinus tigrinus ALCF2SS1-6]RPD80555.1 MFS general substrate transporter [Lentinus tigrinus ALCF2SS1-7]
MDVQQESSSSIEKRSIVDDMAKPHVATQDVDVAAGLTAGKEVSFTPEEAARVRRKIDWHLMPLMCILYMMQFADKTTLGQSAVLGLLNGPKHYIDQAQFNWLSTIFYLFFLGFEWPQNLALQYLPVGKWMSFNIFVWSVALLCHTAARNFGEFFACRAFLGICEGAITPGFMIVTSMFYTRQEQTQRVGYWFLMNGAAIIFLGLVAYGTLHIHNDVLQAWQWLMIITGIITFVVSILFWFFFPNSPANAWFLTAEERVIAIERIKVNQAGVENKHFKVAQFVECLRDPKTWLFFFFAAISNVTNSLSNQRQIIVAGFGFTPIQTTLLGCVDGAVEIIVIFCTVTSATYWKNGRAYSGFLAYCVAILGSILVNALPSDDRVGLLFSYWISITSIAPFVVMLAWVGSTTAGHTKRLTTNAIVMIGYAVGNSAGPQYWEKKYQPRNHVPWLILSICWAVSAIILLVTRFYLAWENARRDRETHDATYDDVYITEKQEDGTVVEKKVDRAFLDLTDMQNRDFRYVL